MTFLKKLHSRYYTAVIAEGEDQPVDDDIFLQDAGRLGSQTSVSAGGKHIGTYNSNQEAEDAIVDWINKNKWSPNIWYITDHGNVDLYKLSPENQRKIKL